MLLTALQHTGTLAHGTGRSRSWGAQITLTPACLTISVFDDTALITLLYLRTWQEWRCCWNSAGLEESLGDLSYWNYRVVLLLLATVGASHLLISLYWILQWKERNCRFHSWAEIGEMWWSLLGLYWALMGLERECRTQHPCKSSRSSPSMCPLQTSLHLCTPQLPWPRGKFFWCRRVNSNSSGCFKEKLLKLWWKQIPAGSNEVVFCPTTLGRSCARASIQGTEGCYTTAQDWLDCTDVRHKLVQCPQGGGNHFMTYKPHKRVKSEAIADEDGENVHC